MPLVLRIATFIMEGRSTDAGGSQSTTLNGKDGAGKEKERKVPLWLSHCITRRTTAKELIMLLLTTVTQRMQARLWVGDGDDAFSASATPKRAWTPKRLRKSSSASASARDAQWALCVQDENGAFHLCGDSQHYASSRLINIPYLAAVAVSSHKKLEAARRALASTAQDSPKRRQGNDDGDKEDAKHGDVDSSQASAPLSSTAAALQFAEEHSMKFALVSCAIVPLVMLRRWNGKKKKIHLYDEVRLPSELGADPVPTAATGEAGGASRSPPLPGRRVHILERSTSTASLEEGGAVAHTDFSTCAGAAGMHHPSAEEDAPSRLDDTPEPLMASVAETEAGKAELDGSGESNPSAAPPLPLQEADKDDRIDEGQAWGRRGAGATPTDSASTSEGSEARRAREPRKSAEALWRAQLATHATSFTSVGSLHPVPALPTREMQSVWRRPDVALDGVAEDARQRMIAEEDAARLHLAKAHLLYDDAVKRHQAMVGARRPSSASRGGDGDAGSEDDGEMRDLVRRRDALRREIKVGEDAERECDRLALLVEFYEKELADSDERIARLRAILEVSA